MSLYTRARKHIDMKRVKELREEKIKREKIDELMKHRQEIIAELRLIEIEEYKEKTWGISESMTTAGLGIINLEGSPNVLSNETSAFDSESANVATVVSGGAVKLGVDEGQPFTNLYPGSANTQYRQASFTFDSTRYDTLVINITNPGGGQGEWCDPNCMFDNIIRYSVYDTDNHNNLYQGTLSNGDNTIRLPSNVRVKEMDVYIRQFASNGVYSDGYNPPFTINSISTKRLSPISLFVALDDPEANSFVRDGTADKMSPEEKRKKLEEQLRSSEEYLNKMFGSGMPQGATVISDIQAQQTFMDIRLASSDIALGTEYGSQSTYGTKPDGSQGFPEPGEMNKGNDGKWYEYGPDGWIPVPSVDAGGGETQVASARGPYGTPGADKPYTRRGYKDKDGKFVDFDNPATWPKIPKAQNRNSRLIAMVAHHEPEGEVIVEKKRLKSPKSLADKIPGYYDGKPSPLGFPVEEPPKMVNGYHPDLVDGKKVANRFNRLDPISARSMPKTGNPHIDKKVRKASKKPK